MRQLGGMMGGREPWFERWSRECAIVLAWLSGKAKGWNYIVMRGCRESVKSN